MVTNRHWLPRLRPTKGRRGTHFYRKAGERAITTYETSLQEALTYDTVTLLDTLQTYRERLDPLADLNSVEVLVENVPSVFDTGWMECSSPRQEWWIEGQYHQTRCGKTTCVECSVLDARGIATDIAQSAPSHHLGISQVDRSLVKEFVKAVRKTVPSFQYVYAMEVNPRQTVVHSHGYYHSQQGYVCDQIIDAASKSVGFGTFKQGAIWSDAQPRYFSYPLKTVASPSLRPTFMDLNGTEGHHALIHATRGFWRDGPTGESMSRKDLHSLVARRANGQRFGAQQRQSHADLVALAERIREG